MPKGKALVTGKLLVRVSVVAPEFTYAGVRESRYGEAVDKLIQEFTEFSDSWVVVGPFADINAAHAASRGIRQSARIKEFCKVASQGLRVRTYEPTKGVWELWLQLWKLKPPEKVS